LFEKHIFQKPKKHHNLHGQVDRGNFTFSLSENRT
jgi:hypothetical protein